MNLRFYITGFVLLVATAGCIKDFNLTPKETTPLYVIEGRISNLRGPYYVRVTKSTHLLRKENKDGHRGIDSSEPVKGALVMITDDLDVTDTLVPARSPEIPRYWYFYKNGVIDSSMQTLSYPTYFT